MEELKELLSSARLPTSGNKAELLARLQGDARTSKYGEEARSGRMYVAMNGGDPEIRYGVEKDGVSVESLKSDCERLGLKRTGSKHELIVRLLRRASGLDSGVAASSCSSAAASASSSSAAAPSKPRKAPVLKNMSALGDRITKACTPDKSAWSNQRYKNHCSDVFHKIEGILSKSALAPGVSPVNGLAMGRACFTSLYTYRNSVTGWGYGDVESDVASCAEFLVRLYKAGGAALPRDQLEEDRSLYGGFQGLFADDLLSVVTVIDTLLGGGSAAPIPSSSAAAAAAAPAAAASSSAPSSSAATAQKVALSALKQEAARESGPVAAAALSATSSSFAAFPAHYFATGAEEEAPAAPSPLSGVKRARGDL